MTATLTEHETPSQPVNGPRCGKCGAPMIPVQGTNTWVCPQC
jgi:hypothetical protein